MAEAHVARLYLDEDVHRRVASALRLRQYDIVSAHDAHRWGLTDDEQLGFAASQGRAIVTFNVADFVVLHGEWLRAGRTHAGIIVSEQLPIGIMVRRLLTLLGTRSAEDLALQLLWLQSFR